MLSFEDEKMKAHFICREDLVAASSYLKIELPVSGSGLDVYSNETQPATIVGLR
jgi:hypothetical protein